MRIPLLTALPCVLLMACDSSGSDDRSDAVVFTAGNPLVIEDFPSDGIAGLPGGSFPPMAGSDTSANTTAGDAGSADGGAADQPGAGISTTGSSTGATVGISGSTTGGASTGESDGTVNPTTDGDTAAGGSTAGSGPDAGATDAATTTAGTGADTGGSTAGNTTGATSGSTTAVMTPDDDAAAGDGGSAGSATAGSPGDSEGSADGAQGGDGQDPDGQNQDGQNQGDQSQGTDTGTDAQQDLQQVTIESAQSINDIQFNGVDIDQPFQASQSDYTATAGFLVSSVEISVNGGPPMQLELSAPGLQVMVVSSGDASTYSFAITQESLASFAEQAYLKDASGRQNSEFGTAVAVHGDRIAVLGRSEENRVTVFRRDSGQWLTESVLSSRGDSVDLYENVLVIGDKSAPGRDFEGFGAGAVHVYEFSGGSWNFLTSLRAQHAGETDRFGHTVSLYENTLAVGAPGENSAAQGINGNAEDNSALDAGAVYIFQRTDGNWRQEAYIKGAATDGGDKFGTSVDLFADSLAVGAIGEESGTAGVNSNQNDESLFAAGAAYVFVRRDGQWQQQAYIKPAVTGSSDLFGTTVAISGRTLAVGAPGEDSSAVGVDGNSLDDSLLRSGAVYVFENDGSNWQQQAYIKASNSNDSDGFGSALALSGNTLVVGASLEDSSARGVNGEQQDNSSNNAGAAYIFMRRAAQWQQSVYLHSSNSDAADHFSGAAALALYGDTLVVGAPGESSASGENDRNQQDNSMARAGAAYVFR